MRTRAATVLAKSATLAEAAALLRLREDIDATDTLRLPSPVTQITATPGRPRRGCDEAACCRPRVSPERRC
ncbi:Os03g0420800 [Oryza sativa Japonica Group]|jgi:hypothetical protein|uniref:Os03g0420800 protein n=1 Tax=Oryza sativa subsp. japonica TaxID=39947 RepID=A0A0N7KHG3_ORYSJ|nr:Os03g0420800 [Oryza sativa Japonica Group]